MNTTQNVENVFRPLIGQLVWSVRKDEGFLMMEFGAPFLSVREPVAASPGASPKVKQNLARRRVFVQGQWHLWLKDCEWELTTTNCSVARRSSGHDAEKCLRELDGQILKSVRNGPLPNSEILRFDLGAELQISPLVGAVNDQWSLHTKDGGVVARQADGVLAFEGKRNRDQS